MLGTFPFCCILIIYLGLKIVTESEGEWLNKEETSQRGVALLNHTYKSLYTEDYPSCLMACMHDSQCMSLNYWWNESRCDLNNKTKYSAVRKAFIQDISSTYMGLTRPLGMFPRKQIYLKNNDLLAQLLERLSRFEPQTGTPLRVIK